MKDRTESLSLGSASSLATSSRHNVSRLRLKQNLVGYCRYNVLSNRKDPRSRSHRCWRTNLLSVRQFIWASHRIVNQRRHHLRHQGRRLSQHLQHKHWSRDDSRSGRVPSFGFDLLQLVDFKHHGHASASLEKWSDLSRSKHSEAKYVVGTSMYVHQRTSGL